MMVDVLKIDQTAIQTGNVYVLISNINIPIEYLTNPLAIANRVDNFIRAEYTNATPIYYEVTGTYQLRNRETNTVRQWLGSFSPRVGPMLFETQVYSENSFVQNVVGGLDVNLICARLLAMNSMDSDWVFDQLYSVIIHVSSLVPKEYHILYRRDLLNHGRKNTRKVATFDLP